MIGFAPAATTAPWTAPNAIARTRVSTRAAAGTPQPSAIMNEKAIALNDAVSPSESEKKLPEIVTKVSATATIPMIEAERTMISCVVDGDEPRRRDPPDETGARGPRSRR